MGFLFFSQLPHLLLTKVNQVCNLYLEWISVNAFNASVSHESVIASNSMRNWSHVSRLAGPRSPSEEE